MHYYDIHPVNRSASTLGAATYHHDARLVRGQVVRIPYGSKRTAGVVLGSVLKPKFKTKPIDGLISEHNLPNELMETAQTMNAFYPFNDASTYSLLVPSGAHKQRRNTTASTTRVVDPSALVEQPPLRPPQTEALKSLQKPNNPTTSWLLHGVTGSGKTRVFFEHAKTTLKQGRDVILLVPEIALSHQLVERAQGFFSSPIYQIHSNMTESENHKTWQSILEATEPCLVIGPRSAIFSPVKKLGLIIADEAHDQSYKQDQTPQYYALHVAAIRAKHASAQLVLGSATPNVTEFWLSKMDKIGYLSLPNTIHEQTDHERIVVDSRHTSNFTRNKILSNQLLDSIHTSLTDNMQTLLYVNRRGHAPIVMCSECDWRAQCDHCTLPLVFHSQDNTLRCHVCNIKQSVLRQCPLCGSPAVRYVGTGTQRVETEVKKLFPHAIVARLDKDSDDKTATPELFKKMHTGEIDILVGTQMITKGFDFKQLSTVGIINADSMLYLPDFRSSERSFQVIYQAIGRNDRTGAGGTTIIQTSSPKHPAIQFAINQDYKAFYESEITDRKLASFPPYSYLLRLVARRKTSGAAHNALNTICNHLPSGVTLLGPAPALHSIQGGKHVWHAVIVSTQRASLLDFAKNISTKNVSIDMDPLDLL